MKTKANDYNLYRGEGRTQARTSLDCARGRLEEWGGKQLKNH